MIKKILYISGLIFFLALWQFFSFVFSSSIVPEPLAVFNNIFSILCHKNIYFNLGVTLMRSLTGFFLALTIGFCIGLLNGRFAKIEKPLFLPVMILQGSPPILWVIPLVLILGTTGFSTIIFVFLVILPFVILNIQEGTKNIKKENIEMFKIYADSKKLIFFYLFIPELSPYLKSTIFLGIILSLKSSILAEWFAARNGVGRIINEYFYSFDMLSFYSIALIYLMMIGAVSLITKKISDKIFSRKKSLIKKSIIKPEKVNPQRKQSSALFLENLSFAYGKKAILKEINFKIEVPKTILLTGESGAGKTTFAKLAAGLIKPSSGSIKTPDNCSLIFQDDIFVQNIDVFLNAALPAIWKKNKAVDESTFYYLEKCGLKNAINIFPDELSGGMKKRLAFARALVFDPDFIILDEPFVNLHKEARAELWELYFELFKKKNIPSIIITHYPEELKDKELETFILKEGKINKKN